MSSNHQRPDQSGRAACARLGASASCLVVTILAANQAAARDAPTPLPYLVQSSPVALRFAAVRPPTPPPPRPGARPPDPDPAVTTEASAPGEHASNPAATAPPGASGSPGSPGSSAPPAPANGQPPAAKPSDSGLPILPDEYAKPPPVTVQDLLPYFVPTSPPASRATYEIK